MSTNENKGIILLRQELPTLQSIMALNKKGGDLATLAAQEISYLEAVSLQKPILMKCNANSVLLAVKSVLKQNLTLDPYAGLVYIKTRNVNTGTQAAPVWETTLEIQPTCNGLISIARQCGRILDIKRPVVTKDTGTGRITGVSVELLLPSIPEPRWETFEFTDEEDFYRWRRASHNENGRNKQDANAETFNYANPNYTNFKGGIDPEFARAKAIRHALKKLGTNLHELKPGTMVIHTDTKSPLIDIKTAISEAQEVHEVKEEKKELKADLPDGNDL